MVITDNITGCKYVKIFKNWVFDFILIFYLNITNVKIAKFKQLPDSIKIIILYRHF